MSCCNCNPYTVKSTEITADATTVTIMIPQVVLRNRQPLSVILTQNIPTTVTADHTVVIESPDFKLTLLTPWGNLAYGDQLLTRRVLRTRIATDTSAAFLINTCNITRTQHQFTTLPEPAKLGKVSATPKGGATK